MKKKENNNKNERKMKRTSTESTQIALNNTNLKNQ